MTSLTLGYPLATYEIASGASPAVGDIVALNSEGKIVVASDAASITVIGECVRVQNGTCEVHGGIISLKNDTTNAVTRAMRGRTCYIKDKETVDSNGGTNKVPCGIVIDVYEGEVYVNIDAHAIALAKVAQQASAIEDLAADANAATIVTTVNSMLAVLRKNGIISNA